MPPASTSLRCEPAASQLKGGCLPGYSPMELRRCLYRQVFPSRRIQPRWRIGPLRHCCSKGSACRFGEGLDAARPCVNPPRRMRIPAHGGGSFPFIRRKRIAAAVRSSPADRRCRDQRQDVARGRRVSTASLPRGPCRGVYAPAHHEPDNRNRPPGAAVRWGDPLVACRCLAASIRQLL
jgi:hypothetical protein